MLGSALPGVKVSIRDPHTGHELAAGEEGEICVAGPNVFRGYLTGGEDGLGRWGEWLRTGDAGAMTEDGLVQFLGVIKLMFTRNGFNIYPRELERAVKRMPGVADVRVRAVPDPLRENDIALEVTGHVAASDVKRWCEQELSSYKQPSTIDIASE
jgi:fatty-acyl-CoA synthase